MKEFIQTCFNGSKIELGMDSKNEREGLHIWVGDWVKQKIKGKWELIFESHSIHLTREQCRNLRNEINERLF